MSLKQLITYNSQNDTFYGYEEFGSDIFEYSKYLKIWQSGVDCDGSGSVTGDRLKCIVEYTITKLNECGLIPKVVICDQGSNNLKMRKLFNVRKKNPLLTYSNENKQFKKGNELYSWRDIEDFYNIDCNNKPRLASNIKLNEPIVLKRPLTKNSLHWNFFKEALKFLSEFKINNKRGSLPPFILGWQENIICVQMLLKELNEKYDIEYLLMRRLTQDCIESLFSVLRAKGGNNLTPDASKIQSAIHMCNMLISPIINNTNYEKDASEFLALTKDIITSIISLHKSYNKSDEIDNIDDYYSLMNIEYILMKDETANSVAYVTGWVCSQLDHKPCIEILATKNKDTDTKCVMKL
ncbi:hypothetical protein QTP88_021607 [Uroleucon formosanum]